MKKLSPLLSLMNLLYCAISLSLIVFKKNRATGVIAILVCVMTVVTAHAYDYVDGNGIAYNINTARNTASVTFKTASYNSYSGKVVIPAAITTGGKSYKVVEVGDYAFSDCSGLEQVTLGDNVEAIGKRAFLACSSLKEIVIKEQVTSVGGYAFADCSSLQHVTMSNNAPLTLEAGAFMRCNALTMVDWETVSLLEGKGGATAIGTNAFAGCTSLKQFLLPGNVQDLGNSIFDGCTGMQSLTMMAHKPLAVRSDPFSLNTSQVSIYVPRGVEAGEVAASYAASSGWNNYNIVELDYSFIDNNKFTYNLLGASTVALTGCKSDASIVDVRGSITGSDGTVFNVVAIASGAFKASQVQSLNTSIAHNLRSIGDEAFASCGKLENVTLVEGLESMGENVFKDCVLLAQVKLPSTLHLVPQGAFNGCVSLEQVQVLHGVQEIGSLAFAGCSSLKRISFPRSLARVQPRAFAGATQLQAFYVDPASEFFTSVGGVLIELASSFDYPQEQRGKMKRLVAFPVALPATHYYCPYGVEELAPYCFENATHIKYIAVPATVTGFGEGCLSGCTSLDRINYRSATPVVVSQNAFCGVNLTATALQVPVGTATAYKNAAVWNGFKTIVERQEVLTINGFAYEWDASGDFVIVDIKPEAVDNGVLTIPEGINLSGIYYAATTLKNTATATVAAQVSTLNLSSDKLSKIDTSDGLNPLAALTTLQSLSLSEENPNFELTNGVLTSANGRVLYYYLRSKTDASLTLDSRVDTIGPQAFANNTHLQRLAVNSRLREIGIGAFEGCTQLNVVDSATSVNTIRERAFKNSSLAIFNGGESLLEIGDDAFSGCASLRGFPMAYGLLQSIGSRAFKGCSSLKGAVIGGLTKTIGDNAFEGCTALENVFFVDEMDNWGNDVFKGCPSLSNLWLWNMEPPVVDHTTFEGNNLQSHALWVPAEVVNSYKSHPVWGKFGSINGTYYIFNNGDVNGDNTVNAVDVTMLYNIILGFKNADIVEERHCDVNHDGVVNASDVTMVYNYILNGLDLNSTYKFVNQQNQLIGHTISMSASNQVIMAHDYNSGSAVTAGFSAQVDNPYVLSLRSVTLNGKQCIELVPQSQGYATVVFIVKNGDTSYYHEYQLRVIQ